MISDTLTPCTLSAQGLSCQRGRRWIFQQLDLALAPGQALWLRGPNGCGKTSLLRILAGLAPPHSGQIQLRNASGDRPVPGPAYIGHRNALNDALSAGEALDLLCRLRGLRPTEQQLREALARFGLGQRLHAPVGRLSQGQRRKVALARLWLDAAPIWLLDEPYDALDRAGTEALDEVLGTHLRCGGSLVLTSHQPVRLPGVQPLEMR